MLSEILENIPHKPMKSFGYEQYSGGLSFKKVPFPNDIPPFKPLIKHPSYIIPNEMIHSEYGPPNHSLDLIGQTSNKKSIAVNPKAYDIYHTMKLKITNKKNFVTLPTLIDSKGLEIRKSIGYELKI